VSRRIPSHLAAIIKANADERCEYCRAPQALTGQAFHFDHVVPRSLGGKTTFINLVYACSHCNLAKSGKVKAIYPITRKRVNLFNPRREIWTEHFRWSKDFTKLIGKTPKGRATVVALNMNDELMQYARHFWHSADFFP